MRSVLIALPLLGGCLIVRTNEEVVEDPCPSTQPELLGEASGPFTLAPDWIYFIGAKGLLTRVGYGPGPSFELTTDEVRAGSLVNDGRDLYWLSDDSIMRMPLAGGAPYPIASGYSNLTALVVDDTSVIWASSAGIDRWSKADQSITNLDTANLVIGLGTFEGITYYSDTSNNRVRRAPPVQDLATAHFPGPLHVDANGLYYFENGDPFAIYTGTIHLVPIDGGEPVTTAEKLAPTLSLVADDNRLYFASTVGSKDEYRIKTVSRFGGTVTTLACGHYEGEMIYLDERAEYLYWTDRRGLYRLAKDPRTR
jgi:hypothetical protein